MCGPTPQGVGGLKLSYKSYHYLWDRSHPARGGWIEMELPSLTSAIFSSHPARGGWIEIRRRSSHQAGDQVLPPTGPVDWNVVRGSGVTIGWRPIPYLVGFINSVPWTATKEVKRLRSLWTTDLVSCHKPGERTAEQSFWCPKDAADFGRGI